MRLLPTGSHPHAESTRASASLLEPISFFFSHRRWVPFFSGGASFEHPPRTRTRARVVRRAARGFPGATRTRVMMLRAPPGSHPHAENTHASAPLLAGGSFFPAPRPVTNLTNLFANLACPVRGRAGRCHKVANGRKNLWSAYTNGAVNIRKSATLPQVSTGRTGQMRLSRTASRSLNDSTTLTATSTAWINMTR